MEASIKGISLAEEGKNASFIGNTDNDGILKYGKNLTVRICEKRF